jgi:shikimate kinase
MKQTGYAYAFGAGTIINAIATWKGAAFGIDLKTEAEVILTDSKEIQGYMEEGGDTSLIERCVELVLSRFGSSSGAKVSTKSEIPMASGLKSSSAAANATVLAALDALGEKLPPLEAIKIGVQAALDSKVTITGAFDDACASMLGGFVITDNKKMELISRVERDSEVLILAPERKVFSSSTNVARSGLIGRWVELAYNEALAGNYEKAMTLNGFLYCAALGFSTEPMFAALEAGIEGVSLSGTGPSYAALGSSEILDKLEPVWRRMGGKVIRTKVINTPYSETPYLNTGTTGTKTGGKTCR